MNSDRLGRSLPTQVRIYQLKGITRLANAAFEDVWLRDQEVLGSDLVDSRETVVFPNEHQTLELPVVDGTLYVAAVAIFREPDNTRWRVLYQLPGKCTPSVSLGVLRLQLVDNRVLARTAKQSRREDGAQAETQAALPSATNSTAAVQTETHDVDE